MTPLFTTRERCPCCASQALETVFSCPFSNPPVSVFLLRYYGPRLTEDDLRDMAGADYALIECRECGLIFQRDIPGDVLMDRLYEQWIDVAASREKSECGHDIRYFSGMATEIEGVVSYLDRRPSDIVFLDFGMGWGNWSRMAQAHGCQVIGMETSSSRRGYVESKGIRCISYDEIAAQRFDFIHTEQVFEHLPEPSETLTYLARSLRPGGLIKISVPNGWGVKDRLNQLDWKASRGSSNGIMPIHPLEHINCFHQAAIQRMAADVGLALCDLLVGVPRFSVTNTRKLKKLVKSFCYKVTKARRFTDPGSTCLYFVQDQ